MAFIEMDFASGGGSQEIESLIIPLTGDSSTTGGSTTEQIVKATPKGRTISSSSHGSNVAYKAFDNSTATYWHANPNVAYPQYVGYEFENKVKAYYGEVLALFNNSHMRLKTYKIQGSNDNSNWVDLTDTLTYFDSNVKQPFILSQNIDFYKSYRVYGMTGWDSGKMAICEITLYGFSK